MRVCIRRESDLDDGACGLRSFSWTTTDAGRADWKIELIARPGNPNPNGTLTITFNSLAPSATLNSFRFNGTGDPTRNGFTAEFATLADGEMAIRGNFEDNSFNYQLVIQPCSEAVCNQTSSGHNFQAMLAGSAGTAYTVSVFSPDETTTAGGPAFVQSTISWH